MQIVSMKHHFKNTIVLANNADNDYKNKTDNRMFVNRYRYI